MKLTDTNDLKQIMGWLKEELSYGPESASVILKNAKENGISMGMLNLAASLLGVDRRKKSKVNAPWDWSLPDNRKEGQPL